MHDLPWGMLEKMKRPKNSVNFTPLRYQSIFTQHPPKNCDHNSNWPIKLTEDLFSWCPQSWWATLVLKFAPQYKNILWVVIRLPLLFVFLIHIARGKKEEKRTHKSDLITRRCCRSTSITMQCYDRENDHAKHQAYAYFWLFCYSTHADSGVVHTHLGKW
jgi:hypothetical protein